jgi:hypothetical protein
MAALESTGTNIGLSMADFVADKDSLMMIVTDCIYHASLNCFRRNLGCGHKPQPVLVNTELLRHDLPKPIKLPFYKAS